MNGCSSCPSYPCQKLLDASKTISGGILEITIRKMMEEFTESIGCKSFPTEIIITQRSSDLHAQIKDHPELWAAGRYDYDTVGNLVLTHKGEFGVKITFPEKM